MQLNRELAATDPARHTSELARSLTDLGISLRARAAHGDALAVTSEAVQLGRDLAAAEPARHTAELARSLISLGAGLRAPRPSVGGGAVTRVKPSRGGGTSASSAPVSSTSGTATRNGGTFARSACATTTPRTY